MDAGNFFRHLCELVLRHQMRVSNYFINSFYSVGRRGKGAYSKAFNPSESLFTLGLTRQY